MNRLFAVLLALSIFITAFDRVFALDTVRNTTQSLVTPLSYELYRGGLEVQYWIRFVVSLPRIYSSNQSLMEEIATLQEKLLELHTLQQENSALREQIGVAGQQTSFKVLGSVVGMVEEENSILILVNKGEGDGVAEGDIVVVGKHLVGRVLRVTQNTSFVLPAIAVESRIAARVITSEGTVTKGFAKGVFNQNVMFDEVLQEQSLPQGGIVVTSGESGIYPADFIIGEIMTVHSTETEVFKRADLKRFWSVDTLQNVFILVG